MMGEFRSDEYIYIYTRMGFNENDGFGFRWEISIFFFFFLSFLSSRLRFYITREARRVLGECFSRKFCIPFVIPPR